MYVLVIVNDGLIFLLKLLWAHGSVGSSAITKTKSKCRYLNFLGNLKDHPEFGCWFLKYDVWKDWTNQIKTLGKTECLALPAMSEWTIVKHVLF